MDHKFTLKIEAHNYSLNSAKNKSFANEYGDWHVHVSSEPYSELRSYFKFIIVFVPTRSVPEEALKDLKIKVDFINQSYTSYTNYSHKDKAATQRGSLPMYECYFSSSGLSNGYRLYSIDIKIDADSIRDLTKQPTNISVNALNNYTKIMFETNKLADVKIKTKEKKEIGASKFILSRSPVFDAMLNRHNTKEAQEGIIKITDINHEVLVEMVRYMYTDEIPKLKEMALDLLVAGDKYILPGLVDKCELHLMRNITNANFSNILITADKLVITNLKNAAIKYIIDNHDVIFTTTDWKSLKQNNFQLGMKVMEQCVQALSKNINNK